MKYAFSLGLLILGASFISAAESDPDQPSPEMIRARELIRELGDVRYRVREEAARELRKMGRQTKAALLEGKQSTDPEISNRCTQLLPEILAIDLKARVDAFLADAEGKKQHDMPMVQRYRQIAGTDPAARKLFSEIILANAVFLDACERDPESAGEKYAVRSQEIQRQLVNINRGINVQPPHAMIDPIDVAALFLVGSDADISKNIKETPVNPVSNFLWQQPIQSALKDGDRAPVYRKLFFAWAENRRDINSISQALSVIDNIKMKEGIPFTLKVLKMKDVQVWTRAQAITLIGKMGGKEHVADLTALFEDKTLVTNIQWNNIPITTQVNDIALAMAVHLTGQVHKDYGFDALQNNQQNLLFAYHYLGFSTEEKRGAAFKKWNEWSEAQKKK